MGQHAGRTARAPGRRARPRRARRPVDETGPRPTEPQSTSSLISKRCDSKAARSSTTAWRTRWPRGSSRTSGSTPGKTRVYSSGDDERPTRNGGPRAATTSERPGERSFRRAAYPSDRGRAPRCPRVPVAAICGAFSGQSVERNRGNGLTSRTCVRYDVEYGFGGRNAQRGARQLRRGRPRHAHRRRVGRRAGRPGPGAHRLDAELARRAARWDRSGVWRSDGSRAPWARLSRTTSLSPGAARQILRHGRDARADAGHRPGVGGRGDRRRPRRPVGWRRRRWPPRPVRPRRSPVGGPVRRAHLRAGRQDGALLVPAGRRRTRPRRDTATQARFAPHRHQLRRHRVR